MKRWIIGGALVVAVAVAASAWAAIPSGNVIDACYNKSAGDLRVVDPAEDQCRTSELSLAWNVQGPQGETGETGPQGLQGPQGPAGASGMPQVYFASGSGTSSITEVAPGGTRGGPFRLSTASVPAGSYVAEAQISAYNYPARLTCSLGNTHRTLMLFRDPDAPLGSATTIFGTLVMSSAFYHGGGGVSLSCSTVGGPPGATTDVDANLVVSSVASVG